MRNGTDPQDSMRQGDKRGGGLAVYRCTKGHKWVIDKSVWVLEDEITMLVLEGKNYCWHCIQEWLGEHIGIVEEQGEKKM